jgi:hypothetical protein
MAYFIPLRKEHESPASVEYSFDGPECGRGVARLNKQTGEVKVRNHSSLSEGGDPISARIETALHKLWEQQDYPDVTSWSS